MAEYKSKLESIKNKLQAYKVLPQTEYRAIGEHLLPEILSVIDEREKWEDEYKKERELVFTNMVVKMATEGLYTQMVINGEQFTLSVSKTINELNKDK